MVQYLCSTFFFLEVGHETSLEERPSRSSARPRLSVPSGLFGDEEKCMHRRRADPTEK